jgi:hypothetical protein
MSLAAVVEFAASERGKLYARSCEAYGVDPGAAFDDDVLAVNARLAFLLTRAREPRAELDDDGTIRYEGGIA